MSDRTPYTYFVEHLPTGLKYYGSKYGKGANPDTFWTDGGYFTSSLKVKLLLEKDGPESFRAEVRKVFDTPEAALKYEYRFLEKVNALHDDMWLNANLGGEKFCNVGPMSEDALQSQRNKKQTPESNAKRSAALKGRIVSDATKQLMSEVQRNRPKEEEEARRDKIRSKALGRLHSDTTKAAISKVVSETRWVRRDGEQKKINLCELDLYLSNGWVQGRIFTAVVCPHCGATGVKHNIMRHHFDNCKHKGNKNDSVD